MSAAPSHVEHVAFLIHRLTLVERKQLLTILREGGDPDIGAREPRTPSDDPLISTIALEIDRP